MLSEQLADVQAEVKRLAQKWDRMTTAPVLDRLTQPETDRRSPSPRRRVTFNDQQTSSLRQPQTRPMTAPFNSTRPMAPRQRGYRGNQQRYGTWRGPNPQTQQQQTGMQHMRCQRCGQEQHPYPNTCPASNRQCNYCSKRGHFSSVCRATARDWQMQRRTEWRAARSYAGYEGQPYVQKHENARNQYQQRRCTTVVRQPICDNNYITVRIAGRFIKCLIDIGSVASIINQTMAERLHLRLRSLQQGQSKILFSASGTPMPVVATAEIAMCFFRTMD